MPPFEDDASYPFFGTWLAKTTEDISDDQTGSIQLYAGGTWGSETATTDAPFLARNRTGAAIGTGAWVYVAYVQGRWEILVAAVCSPKNEAWAFTIGGSPTSGNLGVLFRIGSGSLDTISIPYNATSSQVVTEFETHTGVGSGDVVADGGPFPDNTINVYFSANLASTHITSQSLPVLQKTGLEGVSGVTANVTVYRGG